MSTLNSSNRNNLPPDTLSINFSNNHAFQPRAESPYDSQPDSVTAIVSSSFMKPLFEW